VNSEGGQEDRRNWELGIGNYLPVKLVLKKEGSGLGRNKPVNGIDE
jgi:hypothetical protein